MDSPLDLATDWLADVPLSVEQRHIWNALRAELKVARNKLAELEERLRNLEHENHNAAILSRPEFNREVARMLAFDERYGGQSSLLYFDIDNLDAIESGLGRPMADAVVRTVCDTLIRHIRTSDIFGRLATDEFGVLLSRCDNASAWTKGAGLADTLYQACRQIPGCTVEPVVNYGAYTFREKENVATGLKRAAEVMTETAKPT